MEVLKYYQDPASVAIEYEAVQVNGDGWLLQAHTELIKSL